MIQRVPALIFKSNKMRSITAEAVKVITAVIVVIINVLLALLDDSLLALLFESFPTLFLALFGVSRENVEIVSVWIV